MAGILWSMIGIGIRMIESANVWQILLYRSLSLVIFLFIVLIVSKILKTPRPVIFYVFSGLLKDVATNDCAAKL